MAETVNPALVSTLKLQIKELNADHENFEALQIYVQGRNDCFKWPSGCSLEVDDAKGLLVCRDEGVKDVPQAVYLLNHIVGSVLIQSE